MRLALSILSCVLFVALTSSAALARDPFNGRWQVTMIPDPETANAGNEQFDDTLIFEKDLFSSEACAQYGFKPVKYELDSRAITAATFTASPKSETDGSAKWEGFTTGQDIRGTVVWTKADGTVLRYSFQGARQQ